VASAAAPPGCCDGRTAGPGRTSEKTGALSVYVSDPERLAALTASDPVVFEKADSLASRDNYGRRLLVPSGLLIGGGLILAGTLTGLATISGQTAVNGPCFPA